MQVFDMFDIKCNGVIEFGEFVRSLSIFHPRASDDKKIECMILLILHQRNQTFIYFYENLILFPLAVAFKLFDLGKTGYIEHSEVSYRFSP